MGQSKSKQVYAFQPLPWPETLTAFRLIDQICGIASTYATTHLDKHATVVLDKVSELQRLPYLWDAFENDFERLRGTHMVRLASELHNVLEKLEGCKYDLGMLAEKGLTFKSHRKAAERALALLREVEEAHRAFHYAFELALYASMREHQDAVTAGEAREGEPAPPPELPTRAPGSSGGGSGSGRELTRAASSGGGTAVMGLRRAYLQASSTDSVTAATAAPPPPPAVEDSWMHDARSLSSTPRWPPSPGRVVATSGRQAPSGGGEIEPASPRQPPPPAVVAAPSALRRPRTADASTTAQNQPPPAAAVTATAIATSASPPPQRPRSATRLTSPSAALSSRRRHGMERRSRDGIGATAAAAADQQYVVMYLPQGLDGSGPRAILVPSDALQPAPSSPGPAVAATTVMGGISPFATHTRTAFAAMPGAAPAPPPPPPHVQAAATAAAAAPLLAGSPAWGGQCLTSPSLPRSPQLQYQRPYVQQQHQQYQQPQTMAYTYMPSKSMASVPSPPPPPPAVIPPPSPPLVPYRSPGARYKQPYGAVDMARLTPSYSGGSLYGAGAYNSSTVPGQTAAMTPAAAPSSPYRYSPGAAGAALHHAPPSAGQYGLVSPYLDAYGTGLHHASHSSTLSPALSMTASGTPDLQAYFGRPAGALSGGGASGGWLSPLAATTPAAPAGVVSAVAPGNLMMPSQPVTAHGRSNRVFALQPQPEMLGVAAAAAQKQQRQAAGVGVGEGARGLSAGRVRFMGRRGGGSDDEHDAGDVSDVGNYDEDLGGRGSGDTNDSHHTYTYGLERRGARAVPSYRTPYRGSDSLDEAYGLPDIYEPFGGGSGSGRKGRRFSDGGRNGSGAALPDLPPSRRRSRGAWGDDDGGLGFGGAGEPLQRRPLSYTTAARPSSSPPLLGGLSRDADLDGIPLAGAAAAQYGSPRHSGAGRGPSLSYERMAALAGLNLDALGGGGAAAGLAATGSHPPRQSPGHNHHGNHPSHPTNHKQLVPSESSLRRAELLSEAVEGGDWAAAVELAGLVRRGWWADSRDGAVAKGLLMQAALRGGSAEAHAALGHMAERGEGLPGGRPDLAAAARHYGAAAAGGHRDATTALAYLLEHGLGVDQDEPRAAQLYAAAAQRNCPTAANNLAKMILDGRGAVAAATAAAAAAAATTTTTTTTTSGTGGDRATAARAGDVNSSASPAALARALFKRAAKAGSASAWYNLGVCHLQQVKSRGSPGGGGGGPGGPLAAAVRDEVESEALRCFGEAAKRGHARAGLRAGYLHLQRSAAAAAVEAFCSAALSAGAAARVPPAAAGGGGGDGAAPSGAGAAAAMTIEAEALWCLAQLAERQAAVLEVRTSAAAMAQPAAAALGNVASEPSASGDGGRQVRSGPSGGDGAAAGGGGGSSLRRMFSAASDGDGGGSRRRSGGSDGAERGSRHSAGDDDGGGGGGGGAVAVRGGARSGADDDVSSTRTGATETRAVGQLLATLAGSANISGPDGAAAVAAAAVAGDGTSGLDDPAAAAAVSFAKEICRLDLSCCHRPTGKLPFTAASAVDAQLPPLAAEPIRGLRRLRRQAREVTSELAAAANGGGGGSAATPGSVSEMSSVNGGGGAAAGGAMVAALARLELELQQPAERARSARRAASELMAAAAALGHAAAQHWLAGWRWALGQSAAAVALWEAAGRRGHSASLMVLGQMAEDGRLPPAAAAADEDGGGGGADLAAAARYYLRAQEGGAPGAVEAMRRVQRLLQRHVALQGKLEAVAAGGGATVRAGGGGGGLSRRP